MGCVFVVIMQWGGEFGLCKCVYMCVIDVYCIYGGGKKILTYKNGIRIDGSGNVYLFCNGEIGWRFGRGRYT